jgi:hypothetical protein
MRKASYVLVCIYLALGMASPAGIWDRNGSLIIIHVKQPGEKGFYEGQSKGQRVPIIVRILTTPEMLYLQFYIISLTK